MKSANALDYSPLKFLEPVNCYGVYKSKVKDLTYEQVKSVIRTIRNIKTWKDISDIFETVFGITNEQFLEGKVTYFFAAKNYVIKEFERIVKTENKLLSSISKNHGKWIAAGGERLNRFGDILPLNQLGKIYGVYPFELKDYKYTEILMLLTIEKEQNEVERKMSEM